MQVFFGLLSASYPDIANDPSAVPLDFVREAARQALERTGQWTPTPETPAPPAQPAAPPPTPPPAQLVLDTHKAMGLSGKAAPSNPPDAVQTWAVRPGKRGRSTDLTPEELAALRHEQEVAERCGMTWAERGPAEGQVSTWRGQAWREGSGRYANRGGKHREYYRDLARRGLLKK